MECLFTPHIFDEKNSVRIEGDEFKHVKALRLKDKEQVLITNGQGKTCLCELFAVEKEYADFLIIERYENLNENTYSLTLAVALLSSRERFEFAVEKAVELGVNQIIPLYSKFTQKMKFKRPRIEAKVIAALKQSKRSVLPYIADLTKFDKLFKSLDNYDNVILFDESGDLPEGENLGNNIILLIGPEGGFEDEEMKKLLSSAKSKIWNLGKRRLRTETAVVNALSLVNYLKAKSM
jgi:16S rRNA (uracil1498-N3)-methyltransferase